MLAQGTDLYVVSEVLEHSSVAITKDLMAISSNARSAEVLLECPTLLSPNGSRNGSQSSPTPDATLAERGKKALTRENTGAPVLHCCTRPLPIPIRLPALFAECPHAILRLVQPHIMDLSTSNSAPGEDGSKPCSISQRAAFRLRHDHHARITSRSTSVP
jgi:hypothetical protein